MRLYLYEDHDSLSVVNMPFGRKFKKLKLSEIKLRIRIFYKKHKRITRNKNGFKLFYIAESQEPVYVDGICFGCSVELTESNQGNENYCNQCFEEFL